MEEKSVLLARPNLFIVKEMKKLMEDCKYKPVKLEEASELDKLENMRLGGIVISIGLHSSVGVGYGDMINQVRKKYPHVPILLASMIDMENMRVSIEHNLNTHGIKGNILSVEDAISQKQINPYEEFVVIQKTDITDESKYPLTRNLVARYFI